MTDSRSQPTNPDVRQHTPTPWRVFTTPDGRKLVGIGDQDGQGILDCGFGVWSWTDAEGIANANLVVEAVNSNASLKARVEELERDLADYKEAAGVEADLRREFAGRVGLLEYSFRNVDELDWKHLLSFIPESGHGKFWKAVFEEVRAALSQSSGSARSPTSPSEIKDI